MSHLSVPKSSPEIEAARALYNIQRWGAKYYDINDAGHVVATPLRDAGATVDLTDVIEEARGRGRVDEIQDENRVAAPTT